MFTVVIDPGHYKNYNNGHLPTYFEGNAMFKLANFLKAELLNYDNIRVILTREDNSKDMVLEARGAFAIKNKADIFLSLHSDGFKPKPSACGVTTFTSVKTRNGAELANALGRAIATEMNKQTGVTYYRGNIFKQSTKFSNVDWLGVLRGATSRTGVKVAILIEHGFHTNPKECAFLDSEANLLRLARIEAEEIAKYLKLNKRDTNKPEANEENTFTVNTVTNGYVSAFNAMESKSPVSIVKPGKYYVFRIYSNGAINITNDATRIKPGVWINPNTQKPAPTPEVKKPEVKPEEPKNETPITPEEKPDVSGLTPIMISPNNLPVITFGQAVKHIKGGSKPYKLTVPVEELVYYYMEFGWEEGVRWDIALAQAILETGRFTYGNQVNANQNNFAGIGATDDGAQGNGFETARDGVLVHIQHLKAYASKKALNTTLVDPRFKYVQRGYAPYVEWLGSPDNPNNKATGKTIGWASAKDYGKKILIVLNNMLNETI